MSRLWGEVTAKGSRTSGERQHQLQQQQQLRQRRPGSAVQRQWQQARPGSANQQQRGGSAGTSGVSSGGLGGGGGIGIGVDGRPIQLGGGSRGRDVPVKRDYGSSNVSPPMLGQV